MREILFRAKKKNWRELPKEEWWVEGYYCYFMNEHCILPKNLDADAALFGEQKVFAIIDSETLGQYTGLKDKNGNRIWENDIFYHQRLGTFGEVVWSENDEYIGWAAIDKYDGLQCYTKEMFEEVEVIGNIFNNSELLKGDQSCMDL